MHVCMHIHVKNFSCYHGSSNNFRFVCTVLKSAATCLDTTLSPIPLIAYISLQVTKINEFCYYFSSCHYMLIPMFQCVLSMYITNAQAYNSVQKSNGISTVYSLNPHAHSCYTAAFPTKFPFARSFPLPLPLLRTDPPLPHTTIAML